ncbi:MAG TPA: hypothetical protein VIZ68_06645 [Thermoplasmata archaeon]
MGVEPDAVTFASSSGLVFVGNYGSSNVSVIDAATWTSVGPGISVGLQPEDAIFDPASDQVFVANAGSNSVTALDATTGRVIAAGISVGGGPVALALDTADDLIYVANAVSGTVSIINAANDTVVGAAIRVGPDPHGIVYDPTANSVLVSDYVYSAIFVLANPPEISSFDASVNPVEPGIPTILRVAAVNGTPPLSYSYGGLPSGCTTTNTPALPCVPAAGGTFNVTVTVTDAYGYAAQSSLLVLVEATPTATLVATPSVLETGETLNLTTWALGGIQPATLSYLGLPGGCLSLNSSQISCSPSQSGSFVVWVTTTDRVGVTASASTTLQVVAHPTITAFFASAKELTVGTAVTLTARAIGGLGAYSWSFSGLPPGCASENSPGLTCTPSAPGNFTPSAIVTDGHGWSAAAGTNVSVEVTPVPKLALLLFVASPPSLTQGGSTTLEVRTSGGEGPLSYRYSTLPSGCASANVSSLACTPISAGAFDVTVTVTDSAGAFVTGNVSLFVTSPTALTPVWPVELIVGGVALVVGVAIGYLWQRRHRAAGNPPPDPVGTP